MQDLERAIELVERLRDLVAAELEQARTQSLLVKVLDNAAIFERARQRNEFNVQVAQHEAALGEALAAAGQALQISQVTVGSLRAAAPEPGARLAAACDQLAEVAAALRQVDEQNKVLTEYALSRVRGYVSALSPKPVAYDRRGASRPTEPFSLSNRVA